MGHKVIITCAVTGSANSVKTNPAVPVTPKQIADSAIDAAKAGAAVVHIHVRDPETAAPSMELGLFREVVERIRASETDVAINLSSGYGCRFRPGEEDLFKPGPGTNLIQPEQRVRHVQVLRPEICSLDVATMNLGGPRSGEVFMNTPTHLKTMADIIRKAGVRPEVEVFEPGHIMLARNLIDNDVIETPLFFQLCLGIQWGTPATSAAMKFMLELLPPDVQWAAFGISRAQFPMAAQSVLLGGHLRVGLEDNLYLEKGVLAPSNAALVEKAVPLIHTLGAEVASPAEARELLSLRMQEPLAA